MLLRGGQGVGGGGVNYRAANGLPVLSTSLEPSSLSVFVSVSLSLSLFETLPVAPEK